MNDLSHYIHYLLWAYFLFMPLYIYLNIDKDKALVKQDANNRIKVYKSTMLELWIPTLLVLLLIATSDLTLANIGLTFSTELTHVLTLIAVVAICIYLVYSLKAINHYSDKQNQEVKKQLSHVDWFMPANKSQRNWMVFGVSVSAGVCEEILFRGYLINHLSQYINEIAALAISSIAFGLCHIYQGWQHVIRTGILGAIMAAIYLMSDSLFAPIILHFAIDAYGGQMAYKVNRSKYAVKA